MVDICRPGHNYDTTATYIPVATLQYKLYNHEKLMYSTVLYYMINMFMHNKLFMKQWIL